MKKLFLCSSFKDVEALLSPFAGDLQGKSVTFIPTASRVEKVIFYVEAGRKALRNLGVTLDELDLSDASQEEIEEKLAQNDAVYISGGNTFFLMQEMNRTGAGTLIAQQIEKGKLYIGESAGAMVAAAQIEYAKAMDSPKKAPELDSFKGLGLVDFYPVPHYGSFPFKKAAEKIMETYQQSVQLHPITNHEAILVQGDQVSIVKKS